MLLKVIKEVVIDKILDQTDTPGTFNTMIDNLRLISQPVEEE